MEFAVFNNLITSLSELEESANSNSLNFTDFNPSTDFDKLEPYFQKYTFPALKLAYKENDVQKFQFLIYHSQNYQIKIDIKAILDADIMNKNYVITTLILKFYSLPAFYWACENNMLELANGALMYIDKVTIDYDYIFANACAAGYLDIIKLIFSINPNYNFRYNQDFIFRNMCRLNKIDIVMYFINLYGGYKIEVVEGKIIKYWVEG